VLRAVGETETTQENIQNLFELDGDPGFQLLIQEEIDVVIFLLLFLSALPLILNFPFTCFPSFF
jgi:hypothetical protein